MAEFNLPTVVLDGPDDTIATMILRQVASMRKDGSLAAGTSLCWDPAQLELLAMFAVNAKRDSERLDWLDAYLLSDGGKLLGDDGVEYPSVRAGIDAERIKTPLSVGETTGDPA